MASVLQHVPEVLHVTFDLPEMLMLQRHFNRKIGVPIFASTYDLHTSHAVA